MKDKRRIWLKSNGHDWYVVKYTNNTIALTHETMLSAIIQCGEEMSKYDIKSMQRCGDFDNKLIIEG